MTALSDLIARLEAAKEESRELDVMIGIATGWRQRDKRRAKARVYQRGYYKVHRDKILHQRKKRAEKRI